MCMQVVKGSASSVKICVPKKAVHDSQMLISKETDDTGRNPLDKFRSHINRFPRKVMHVGKQGQKHNCGINE